MCQFASFVVMRDETVHWFAGVDSHSEILRHANLDDTRSEFVRRNWANVEVIPPDKNRDHRPLTDWNFVIDEATEPDWFTASHKRAVLSALESRLEVEKGEYVVETDGHKEYYKNGRLHRDNGPAVIYADGRQVYYKNGQLHREDGPAVEYLSGEKVYYKNGQVHRDNGPAVINVDGSRIYYKNGQVHRDNGPAVIYANGNKEYWKNGQLEKWSKI